jgi:hypothetical protein
MGYLSHETSHPVFVVVVVLVTVIKEMLLLHANPGRSMNKQILIQPVQSQKS